MNNARWQILLGLVLVGLSAVLYELHYSLFHDTRSIFFYLVFNIAFLPIEVLLLTLVAHRLLNRREKRLMLQKLNMVIGTFYSEVGTPLLRTITREDQRATELQCKLLVNTDWDARQFAAATTCAQAHLAQIRPSPGDLAAMKDFLHERRDFLLRLLENPNLLEHDSFTDLLWAVFHLTDELGHRADLARLTERDVEHLSGDVARAYKLLVVEWLAYMKHLKRDYPYLFSLALRTSPFDPQASPEIK